MLKMNVPGFRIQSIQTVATENIKPLPHRNIRVTIKYMQLMAARDAALT